MIYINMKDPIKISEGVSVSQIAKRARVKLIRIVQDLLKQMNYSG
jgi:hypothetical protein